jgi:hypothetical protein
MTPDLFTHAAAHTATTGLLASRQINHRPRGKKIAFSIFEGETVRTITPAGRDAWALGELITAGTEGCTPIDNPAPRWSAYVHKAKHARHGGDQ